MGTAPIRRRVNILYEGVLLTSVPVDLPGPVVVDSDFIAEALREALRRGIFHGLHLHAVTFSVVQDDAPPERSQTSRFSG